MLPPPTLSCVHLTLHRPGGHPDTDLNYFFQFAICPSLTRPDAFLYEGANTAEHFALARRWRAKIWAAQLATANIVANPFFLERTTDWDAGQQTLPLKNLCPRLTGRGHPSNRRIFMVCRCTFGRYVADPVFPMHRERCRYCSVRRLLVDAGSGRRSACQAIDTSSNGAVKLGRLFTIRSAACHSRARICCQQSFGM